MIDSEFEAKARLLTNAGYFDRVRELCRGGFSVKDAWERVEGELPHGLRRFTSIIAFHRARKKEALGKLPKPLFKVE